MERQPVDSQAIRSVGYDAELQELEIEFRSGLVYRYEGVPRSVFEWLLRTRNKGIFVSRQIAGRYVERRVPAREGTDPELLEHVLRQSLAQLAEPEKEPEPRG